MPVEQPKDTDVKKAAMAAPKEGDPKPPEGYRPLTISQKDEWNGFLRYLYKNGYYGKQDLDTGADKTDYLMNLYRKANSEFTLTKEDVPRVQYEMAMMKKGFIPDSAGNMVNVKNTPFASLIPRNQSVKTMSKMDGRIGSLTSQESFPVGSISGGKNYGTDYWSFINSSNNVARMAKNAMKGEKVSTK